MTSDTDAFAAIREVREACVTHDGHDPLDEAADLALRHHGLDGALLELADGPDRAEDGGFALVRDGELLLAVSPAARGRGLGADLATRVAAAGVPVDRAWSHGGHPAAEVLAERHGFEATRGLWVMRRPVDADHPLPPLAAPDGVRLRGYDAADPADAAAVLRVNAAAFAHHPEQGDLDEAGLAERVAEPWFDADGLVMAVEEADGTLLAFHWTKRHDARLGEVYVVAVSPEAQGRGLGKVVTLAGLHHLADGGVEEILLYVESDNAPAVAVYSGLGFAHAAKDTHVQYTRR
ncbi:MAG: mycothiol synthase [Nocardioides sp.]|nr:mycothiol synthase [Nocardioides sp.]